MRSPNEINTTWWSAVNPAGRNDDIAFQVNCYVASRSIAMALKGIPGIYTHGVAALPNDHDLVARTGQRRDVNRGTIDPGLYRDHLADTTFKRSLLRAAQQAMTRVRTRERVFHPRGRQRVLTPSPAVFCLLRISPEGDRRVLAMTNVTDSTVRLEVSLEMLETGEASWVDLLGGPGEQVGDGRLRPELEAYAVRWLAPAGEQGG